MSKTNLSATVMSQLGRRTSDSPVDADSFGVEIEVEGRGLMTRNIKDTEPFWSIANDGSLRALNEGDQALEYKFKTGLNMADSVTALNALEARLTRPDTVLYPSPRASVHVHVNVLSETMRTLFNYICISYIFEEVLVDMCGTHRVGNNFCLRAKDAEGVIVHLVQNLTTYGQIWGDGRDYRYAATNLCSIAKFGTIEFRAMEFTVSATRILAWMEALNAMKVAAREFRDPQDIVQQFSMKGPRQFFMDVMGVRLGQPYVASVPDIDQKLLNGVQLIQDFAYCLPWIDSAEKPKSAKKPMHNLADENPQWGQVEFVPAGEPIAEARIAPNPDNEALRRWAAANPAPQAIPAAEAGGFADQYRRMVAAAERRQAEERAAAHLEAGRRAMEAARRRPQAADEDERIRLHNAARARAGLPPVPRRRPAGLGAAPRAPGEF